jgi:uncharacterized protein (TIGR02594 family)
MPAWLDVAIEEFHRGVEEIPGREHDPRILEYHASTTLDASDDETPWCSAFVNFCITKAGMIGTNSAAARSWLKWGVPCEPKRGAITVFRRGTSSWTGHVGFWIGEEENGIVILGGNQRNRISYSSYPKRDLLGYRWPRVQDFRA